MSSHGVMGVSELKSIDVLQLNVRFSNHNILMLTLCISLRFV